MEKAEFFCRNSTELPVWIGSMTVIFLQGWFTAMLDTSLSARNWIETNRQARSCLTLEPNMTKIFHHMIWNHAYGQQIQINRIWYVSVSCAVLVLSAPRWRRAAMAESSCDCGVIECRLWATHTVQCVLNAEENRGEHNLWDCSPGEPRFSAEMWLWRETVTLGGSSVSLCIAVCK